MLLLTRHNDLVQICTSSSSEHDHDDFVHHKNISIETMESIATKASYFFKNVDNNIAFKENCKTTTATKRKRDSLISLLTAPRKISNKIQKIIVESSIPIIQKKCVRFDLAATTVRDLGRKSFSSSGSYNSKTAGPIQNETNIPQNELHYEEDQLIKESMWYNRSELRQIKHRAYYISKSVRHLDSEISESYNKCSVENYQTNDNILLKNLIESNKLNDFIIQRGLERWSSIGLSSNRGIDLIVWKTLFFLEQSEQMIYDKKDYMKLAQICSTHSSKSNYFAQLLASIDAYHVE